MMKKTVHSKDWLNLETSRKFDTGLSLARVVPKELSSTTSLFIESLIQLVCRSLDNDPIKQRKVYNAICAKLFDMRVIDESYNAEEFSSLRRHYWEAILKFSRSPDVGSSLLETSRYATEYEELEWLSTGGFGQVFRARHRLDQMEYAVKKIKVRNRSSGSFLRTLFEVKTLARLNHSNIVQYKAAWLEAFTMPAPPAIEDSSSSDISDLVIFEESDNSGGSVSDERDNTAVRPYRPASTSSMPRLGAILYVTMELCNETLRQWLDRRNAVNQTLDTSLAINIMLQVAAGIAYIHKMNVVHHDVKPSNIFISSEMWVQVGDFGLACNDQCRGSCPLLAGHRGTSLYAAPEQLRGKCNQRSDLFSLGLVLLELMKPFGTDMERVAVLRKARERVLPSGLPPIIQILLMDLLTADPNERPSASELLDRLQNCNHSSLDNKDLTILELRRLLAERDQEIRMLKEHRPHSQ